MDGSHFDNITRSLTGSRRSLVSGGLAGAAGRLGLAGSDARKKRNRKRKQKKPQPNAYGCLDVGKACGGDSTQCCSGICEGTKPKKGKKDTSRCVAHDAGICQVNYDLCSTGAGHFCKAGSGTCACALTTGNAPFCGEYRGTADNCQDCSQDTDCHAEFGPGAACVVLGGVCELYCPGTARALCMPSCLDAEM